jgi:hypothetical protein
VSVSKREGVCACGHCTVRVSSSPLLFPNQPATKQAVRRTVYRPAHLAPGEITCSAVLAARASGRLRVEARPSRPAAQTGVCIGSSSAAQRKAKKLGKKAGQVDQRQGPRIL